MHKPNLPLAHALTLTLLLLLSSGCATKPPALPPLPVAPPLVPPLPQQARQPTPPPWCLPTCSAALGKRLSTLADTLTKPETQGLPAKPVTTP